MPFALAWPHGIERTLLAVFLLVGGLGTALALSSRELPLVVAGAIHALAGALAIVAADLVTLLIAWEVLTLSGYAVIRRGSARTRSLLRFPGTPVRWLPPAFTGESPSRAAFWYLAAQICAAALFFVALSVQIAETGSPAIATLVGSAQPFMLAAILIKTAMMPLHGWLVGSYTRAGYAGSFLLSAFATKVGVYAAARTLAFSPGGLPVLSLIGAVVAVVSVGFALAQHSARRLLSFHIVSQVGYMLVGVGLVGSAAGVTAGLFHAVNHIIYKALLFLVVALVVDLVGHDDLRRMGGLARKMPLVFVAAVVGAAAITGVPFTSGYASKELLKKAAGEFQTVMLIVASVGTSLSFTKFLYLIFLRRTDNDPAEPIQPRREAARGPGIVWPAPGAAVTLVVLSGLSVLIGVSPSLVRGVPEYDYYAVSAMLWGVIPVALATGIWFLVGRALTQGSERTHREPMLRTLITRWSRRPLVTLRRAHRVDAQLALGIAVVAAIGLVVVLTLCDRL
ncbi:MAG: proton-conducting transporter membrane subunit [Spirochaetota bacterium]